MSTSAPAGVRAGSAKSNQGDVKIGDQSSLYKIIMTPIIFTTFLISLFLVDTRNSALRRHYHASDSKSRLPEWLHRILYRYKRYEYVAVDENGKPFPISNPQTPATSPGQEKEDFYHSKQKKLMKMEVAEAFEMRNSVVVLFGVLGVVMLWGFWKLASWVIGVLWTLASSR
ncbi:hypothetical protein QBC40DRAFT_284987 [Triangularia verruculosa]|uniref:Uncharacterized protein n=1 Tax=Triangularia verruculosa TaxID=2587418 RepID=A0AAN6XC49_9PEZI|nr:hypothetical protein QBC40DRAFT_284987 [Triangularia verruculosa]